MDKLISYTLIFISFLMTFMIGGVAFFGIGMGVMAYNLSPFLPQFLVGYLITLITLAFFIFSIFFRNKIIKQNKKLGYVLLLISSAILFYIFYLLLRKEYSGGGAHYIFLSLFPLYFIVFSFKLIRKIK